MMIQSIKRLLYLFITFLLLINATSYADNVEASNKDRNMELFSATSIFKPLLADPKWPRFSLAYQYYTKGVFKGHVFAPIFGAALPLVRWKGANELKYEIGLHAALFATMDIQSSPTRLLNTDYFVGPVFAVKNGQWDYLSRISHTSTHLGDEFLLSKDGRKIKRINLSYEGAEQFVAYNLDNGIRPFAGIGYIFHAEPNNYKTLQVVAGFDYRYPGYYLDGYAKPIFGIYSYTSHNFNWRPSLSVKGGLEFRDKFIRGRELQLLLEYYNGNSIQGQFYRIKENSISISLSLNS